MKALLTLGVRVYCNEYGCHNQVMIKQKNETPRGLIRHGYYYAQRR